MLERSGFCSVTATVLNKAPERVSADQRVSTVSPLLFLKVSTFAQPSATTFGDYDYTRSGNPTRHAFEKQVRCYPESSSSCFLEGRNPGLKRYFPTDSERELTHCI